ncbi:hypothetical protein V1264_010803 [Littorina saxatilis]|uniref:Chitinase n=1 Tax=Littorina saxatilis TaxID=31220 RepID=A0AAN9BTC4_9CAEN
MAAAFSSFVLREYCWSKYRPSPGTYTVANVDPALCTHLIYAFAVFDGQGHIRPQEGDADWSRYAEFNGLKTQNPDLKTLLAVGGWGFGSTKFSLMAGDPVTRTRFVTSSVAFLRQHGFDGLDLDWEYPGKRGGSAKDKDNFVLLCKELKQAFESDTSGNKRLILSAAVPAARSSMDIGYNIPSLDRYLDLWNLMTYDYHGAWEGKTGHNSPLLATQYEAWSGSTLNMEWTAKEYVQRGASKHKVMVGLPTYGHSYTLTSPSRHEVGDSASLGAAGPLTRQAGFWAYYEVCNKIFKGTGTVERDARAGVPYYFDGNLWISFDDVESIKEKTRWLKSNGYGGYMTWSLDMDVFRTDLCPSASSPYPLLTAANSVLADPSMPGTPTVTGQAEPTTRRPEFGSGSGPASGGEASTDTPTATGAGSSGGVGSGSQAGSGSGSQTGSGTGSGSGSHTGSGSQVTGQAEPTTRRPEFGSGSGPTSGGEASTDTPTATGAGSSGGVGSGSQAGSGSESQTGSGTGSGSGSHTGSGSQVTGQAEPTTRRPEFGSGSGPTSGGEASTDTPTATGAGSSGGVGSGSQAGSGTGSQTGSGSQEFTCEGRPFKGYTDPSSPCRYIVCWAGTPHYKSCPSGLVFDPSVGVCNWPEGDIRC